MTAETRRQMRLISFKSLVKNSLRGFATVELPNGLRIADCPVLNSNGTTWAAFPSKPQLGQDGRQIEIDGKKQYASFLAWPDRDTADRWSHAVVELVRQQHPEALDEGGAP